MEKVKESSRHLSSEHGLLREKFRIKQLRKLGLNLDNWQYIIALAGNPKLVKVQFLIV